MSIKVMNGPHKYVFTRFQDNFLRAFYKTLTNQQQADMLGLKKTIVRYRCYELGLKKMELQYWTDEQVNFLKDNYRKYGDTELAQMFAKRWKKDKGWDKKHIEKKRRYLQLKRTDDEKQAIKERNVELGMWAMCPVKAWDTRGRAKTFERRVWSNGSGGLFVVIKLKDGFVHYAPWLYRQIYGPVPDGMVVRLKDNNLLNIVPGNLVLKTRAENALLNKQSALPEEWRQVKELNLQLIKEIYARSGKKEATGYAQ